MRIRIAILGLSAWLAFGCGEGEDTAEPVTTTDEVVEPETEVPVDEPVAEEGDAIPAPADFEEEATEEITADNLEEQITELETELNQEMGEGAEAPAGADTSAGTPPAP